MNTTATATTTGPQILKRSDYPEAFWAVMEHTYTNVIAFSTARYPDGVSIDHHQNDATLSIWSEGEYGVDRLEALAIYATRDDAVIGFVNAYDILKTI